MPKKSLHLSEQTVELLERYASEHGITQSQTVERAVRLLVEEPAGNQPGACEEPPRSQAGTSQEPVGGLLSVLTEQLAAKDSQIADLSAALRSMAEAERAKAVSEVAIVHAGASVQDQAQLGLFQYLRSRLSRKKGAGERA